MTYSLRNVWIVQIALSAGLLTGFGALWCAAEPQAVAGAGSGAGGLLAVLAITNAIPVAAAASFLARFNANDRTTDGLGSLAKAVAEQSSRLDAHPRENPSMRSVNYRNLLRRPSSNEYTFSTADEPMLLTPRPYWDGVWYYGGKDIPNRDERLPELFRATHEVVYCAWQTLKIVDHMRRTGLGNLFGHRRGGSQGSKWFLESLHKHRNLIRRPQTGVLSRSEGERLVYLAISSWHYVSEELREYRGKASRDEFREAKFGAEFCLYVTWLNYFQQKATSARYRYVALSGKGRVPLVLKLSDYGKATGSFKSAIDEIYSGFLARVAVAGRIHRVRQGAICPIILTAAAVTCHLVLQPVSAGQVYGWIAPSLTLAAYALSATAVIGNFLFAIWLLVPALSGE